jgi:GT2 family glycosyltransferase
MLATDSYSITFACYNQIEYTRQCIDSMRLCGTPLERLVVVDNASSDETLSYLNSLPLGKVVHNKDNLGCGVAWNQGALEFQSDWTIIMNNDVIVSRQWVEGLINAAIQHKLDIISPAMIEGKLDYDFQSLAQKASTEMRDAVRLGWAHAVCLAVHKRVWKEVGYFRATPKLLGYEDTLFFHEARLAGMRMGTTGASWLHHFGSITQSAMKRERGLKESDDLGYRYNHRLLQQSWLERKMDKIRLKRQLREWREQEVQQYGRSLWGQSAGGQLTWV